MIDSQAAEESRFWQEQRDGVITYGRTLLLVLVSLDLLWWPTDLIGLTTDAALIRAFAISRGWAVLSTVALCIVMPLLRTTRESPTLWVTIQIATVAFVTGYEVGALRGPSAPWFNDTPYVLLAPATLPFRMPERIVATLGLAAALVVGFILRNPANLSDLRWGSAALFLVGLVSFSVLAGVFTEGMRRRITSLQRAMERQSVELRDLNEHLEIRVREQTAEVRQLASHIESAREGERAHIARELHDELGQDLAALRYALKFARIRYEQDSTAIGSYLDDLEQLLDRTTATTRGILSSLRPTVVDDLGLAAAAEWMMKRLHERTGVDHQLVVIPEDPKLPKPIATVAFRILQEALANVARHSQAKRVAVELRRASETLEILVQDDGVGFIPQPSGTGTTGLGLIGVRERVLATGGTVEVESAPGKGTRIHVVLPASEPRA